jgi:hypothetical protein
MLRVVLALAMLAIVPASAWALPTDDEIASISPDDGARVGTNPDGIQVRYLCPTYRIADDGIPLYGGPKDYGVTLSSSPEPGPDGRLVPGAIATGSVDQSVGPGACSALVGTGGARPTIQETPGTYYWQAWRVCTGCPSGYETGPVRKLMLVSSVSPRVSVLNRVYAGFPFIATIALDDVPDGTVVTVERQRGKRWARVATATALGEKAEAVVTLPRGQQRLRARVRIGGETLTGRIKGVAVRAARAWTTSAASDGAYTGRAGSRSVKLTIAGNGRQLRNFRALVAMTCPSVTPGQFTTQIGTAAIKSARIAPDGSFVAATTRSGSSIRVRGRLQGRRVTGRVELSVGTCVGNSAFSARR